MSSTFKFPDNDCLPYVSIDCQNLILQLLEEKTRRISSYKYREQDHYLQHGIGNHPPRKYVFGEDDALDIKSHKWFRGLDWHNLQNVTPGFTPRLRDAGDTRYFEEDEPVSDWSDSEDTEDDMAHPDEIRQILESEGFSSGTIRSFMGMIAQPYDAIRLRHINIKIESNGRLSTGGKEKLKHYAREFGIKERKRPRDIFLRDKTTQKQVMDIRKQTAFLGYTWLKAPSPPRVPSMLEDELGRARANLSLGCDLLPSPHHFPMATPPNVFEQDISYDMYRPSAAARQYWLGDAHCDYQAAVWQRYGQ